MFNALAKYNNLHGTSVENGHIRGNQVGLMRYKKGVELFQHQEH